MRARMVILVFAVLTMSACSSATQHHDTSPSTSAGASTSSNSSSRPAPIPTLVSKAPCFGAAALAAPSGSCARSTNSGPLTPTPRQAPKDRSDAYSSVSGSKDCMAYQPNFPLTTCTFGDPRSTTRVALIGNSHAAQWVPAIEIIAARKRWRVTAYLASQCALADVRQHFDTPATTQACLDWTHRVTSVTAHGGFDLVIMTDKISRGVPGQTIASSQPLFEQGYERVLKPLQRARLRVVGIRDTPSPGFQVPACLAAHPGNYSACNGTRASWLPHEPLTDAVAALHDDRMSVIDMTDYICDGATCAAAVGGVPVYFDVSHLTATYARTLAPYLSAAFTKAMAS